MENTYRNKEERRIIYCTALACCHNSNSFCGADAIHLQGCTPEADNVFSCSEFTDMSYRQEKGSKKKLPKFKDIIGLYCEEKK